MYAANKYRGFQIILLAQCFSIVISLIMGISLNPASPTLVGYLLLDFFMSEELFFFSVFWDFDNCGNTTRHSIFLRTEEALVQSTALSNRALLSFLV